MADDRVFAHVRMAADPVNRGHTFCQLLNRVNAGFAAEYCEANPLLGCREGATNRAPSAVRSGKHSNAIQKHAARRSGASIDWQDLGQLWEGAMPGAREYPKIIAERVQSNATDCCQEYLRLTPNHDGTATLAVC